MNNQHSARFSVTKRLFRVSSRNERFWNRKKSGIFAGKTDFL
jgi:hypothetical protein